MNRVRLPPVLLLRLLLPAGLLGAIGCGEFPDFIPPVTEIQTLRISGSFCRIIVAGESCRVSVRATDRNGNPVSDPRLLWSSSNRVVVSVNGDSRGALLRARTRGRATIRARDANGSAEGTFEVEVIPPRE